MFHFLRWLLGFAPWGKHYECDRGIDFDYVNISGERRHHAICVHLLIERFLGPAMIKGIYPDGSDHEYAYQPHGKNSGHGIWPHA